MTEYVLGFAFDLKRNYVLLIEKKHPKWQAGKLNGVGGKVEAGETAIEAMRREFQEETGLIVADWEHFATLEGRSGDGYRVLVYSAFTDEIFQAQKTTDEPPVVIPLGRPFHFFMRNLPYLIPLALDTDHTGVAVFEYGPTRQGATKT